MIGAGGSVSGIPDGPLSSKLSRGFVRRNETEGHFRRLYRHPNYPKSSFIAEPAGSLSGYFTTGAPIGQRPIIFAASLMLSSVFHGAIGIFFVFRSGRSVSLYIPAAADAAPILFLLRPSPFSRIRRINRQNGGIALFLASMGRIG